MGAMLMAISGLQMLVFTLGMMRKSYMAVALPVFGALGAVSALLFWVGYTMMSMEPETDELEAEAEGFQRVS
jgi:hypothetical protein